jgi:hypothetical protein
MLLTLQAISQWCQGLIASWLNRRSLWELCVLFLVGASFKCGDRSCSGSIADTSGTQRDVKLTARFLLGYQSRSRSHHSQICRKVEERT